MKKSSLIRLGVGTASVAMLVSSLAGVATSSSAAASKGGTLYILTKGSKISHMDPQRNYIGEDLAFTGAYLTRTLVNYKLSSNSATAWQMIGDAATNTGTASDGAKTWKFPIRKGMKWEDGSTVTCADFKYGVARSFSDGITGGPTYAIAYLNIPSGPYGYGSAYPGVYPITDKPAADTQAEIDSLQSTFNSAVICSGTPSTGETITFKLNQPVPDFNGAVTLQAFSAVKKSADTGVLYDKGIMSNGPYKIDTYDSTKLKLVRNPNWAEATDTTRPAYPDVIQVNFNVDPQVITTRLMQNSGDDQNAIASGIYPQKVTEVMTGSQYASRRVIGIDPYVSYRAINTNSVTSLVKRKALMVAWPRAELRRLAGGDFAGSLADGVIKPSLSLFYRATNIWGYNTTTLVTPARAAVLATKVGNVWKCGSTVRSQGYVCTPAVPAVYNVVPHPGAIGAVIPPSGDPAAAAKILSDAGISNPGTISYDYGDDGSEVTAQSVAAINAALTAAGFTPDPHGWPVTDYYDMVLDPDTQGDISGAAWGPDWPNPSTIIPPLFTAAGGFDLSHYDNADFQNRIQTALTTTSATLQRDRWKALNDEVVAQALVIPGLYTVSENLMGSNVKGAYIWAPYGSYPYAALSVQ